MTLQDLHMYLSVIDSKKSKNRVDVAYQGAPDMSKKLDRWAIKAMNQYHNPHTHHFKLKFQPVGNEMVYWGECECGAKDS